MSKSTRLTRALTCLVVGGVFVVAFSGCGPVENAEQDFTTAITAINANSANWQAIVQELETKLNKDASNLESQVNTVVQGATDSLGAQGRCSIDQVGRRVAEQLNNIKILNWLQEQKPSSPQPYPCISVPLELRLGDVESGAVGAEAISGFDFAPQLLDHRLPSVTTAVSVLRPGGARVAVPSEDVSVQPYNILVNVGPTGFRVPSDAVRMEVTFNGGSPFQLPIIGVKAPPPPVTVRNLVAEFDSKDDGKDGDSLLRVELGSGLASYSQPPGTNLEFPSGSIDNVPLNVTGAPTLASIKGAPLEACITPNGNDTWRFDLIIHGNTSDGQTFIAAFLANDVNEAPSNRCAHLVMPVNLAFGGSSGGSSGGSGGTGGTGGSPGGCFRGNRIVVPAIRPVGPPTGPPVRYCP